MSHSQSVARTWHAGADQKALNARRMAGCPSHPLLGSGATQLDGIDGPRRAVSPGRRISNYPGIVVVNAWKGSPDSGCTNIWLKRNP